MADSEVLGEFRRAIKSEDYERALRAFSSTVDGMVEMLVRVKAREYLATIEDKDDEIEGLVDLIVAIRNSTGLVYINREGMQTCALCGVIGPASGGNQHAEDCLTREIRTMLKQYKRFTQG